MLLESDIQTALAASALRRQALLVAVISEDAQLDVVRRADVENAALLHVIRAGTAQQAQFDAFCAVKEVPRIHLFAPPSRDLPPAILAGATLNAEVLARAVAVANQWSKKDVQEVLQWAVERRGQVEASPADEPRRPRPTVSEPKQPPSAPTPKPSVPPVSHAANPPPSKFGSQLTVELPSGDHVQITGVHSKTPLTMVRKQLIAEKKVPSEFFHFVVNSSSGSRKLVLKEEADTLLGDLMVLEGQATLGISNEAVARTPPPGAVMGEDFVPAHPHAPAVPPGAAFQVRLPNGSVLGLHGIHAKSSLATVREHVLKEGHPLSEYFHFAVQKGSETTRIPVKAEPETLLEELGIPNSGAMLVIADDSAVAAGHPAGEAPGSLFPHPHQAPGSAIDVELSDGSKVKVHGVHGKSSLADVRAHILREGLAPSEFFHFILCRGELCRRLTQKEEPSTLLDEIGVPNGGGKLSLSDDSGVKRPPSASPAPKASLAPPETKVITFVHPGTLANEVVTISSADNLGRLWDKLQEPSGDLMFLPGQKRKVTRADAAKETAAILFGETKIMLLHAVAPPAAASPASSGEPNVQMSPPPTSPEATIQLKVILPSGSNVQQAFQSSAPLSSILELVAAHESPAIAERCVLQLAYPPRRFVPSDLASPMSSLKIANGSVIRVTISAEPFGYSSPPQGSSVSGEAPGGQGQGRGTFFTRMTQYIPGLGFGFGGRQPQGPSSQAHGQPQDPGSNAPARDPNAPRSMADLRRREGSEDPDKEKRYYDGNSTEYQE